MLPLLEHLYSTSFYDLTKKTFFLLTLATVARASELKALNISLVRFEWGKPRAVLGFPYQESTIRTARLALCHPTFILFVGAEEKEELLLCPVHTLPVYVSHSKTVYGVWKCLFIPVSKISTTEVPCNTIILQAYKIANLDPPVGLVNKFLD